MSSQKKLTEDILFSYDIILENKNLIREALNIVPLAKTNYSHVKYDYDNTKNDSVNKPLLDDMQAAGQSVGVVLIFLPFPIITIYLLMWLIIPKENNENNKNIPTNFY